MPKHPFAPQLRTASCGAAEGRRGRARAPHPRDVRLFQPRALDAVHAAKLVEPQRDAASVGARRRITLAENFGAGASVRAANERPRAAPREGRGRARALRLRSARPWTLRAIEAVDAAEFGVLQRAAASLER